MACLEEAKKINKSIAALGNCIAARRCSAGGIKVMVVGVKPASLNTVPFRTRRHATSLHAGGNTFTAPIANVGRQAYILTKHFRRVFARRALRVKNSVRVNRKREKKLRTRRSGLSGRKGAA